MAMAVRKTGPQNIVAPVGVNDESLLFLSKANALLEKARVARGLDGRDQLEFAYQAALRAAGAVIAGYRVPRFLKAASAWEKLAKVSPSLAHWAEAFRQLSGLRNNVRLGIVAAVMPAQADDVLDKAAGLLVAVEEELGVLSAAA